MKKLIRTFFKGLLLSLIIVLAYIGNIGGSRETVQDMITYIQEISVKPDVDTPYRSQDVKAQSATDKLGRRNDHTSSDLKPDDIVSPYAILIRLSNQEVLFEKNSTETIYPASLTKIMTALVVIESIPDLEQKIRLTNEIFEGLYEANASQAGFVAGEKVRGIDLLYGLMLPSGAECSNALALESTGSMDAFVDLMNAKAEKLGMKQTYYVNATGLHASNHYTSIQDLSILLTYALQNQVFLQVYTTAQYVTAGDNIYPEGLNVESTFLGYKDTLQIRNGEIIGGKTGYTKEAGLCLSSLAIVHDEAYIFISAGADGDHYTEQYNVMDAVKAYNSMHSIIQDN